MFFLNFKLFYVWDLFKVRVKYDMNKIGKINVVESTSQEKILQPQKTLLQLPVCGQYLC